MLLCSSREKKDRLKLVRWHGYITNAERQCEEHGESGELEQANIAGAIRLC